MFPGDIGDVKYSFGEDFLVILVFLDCSFGVMLPGDTGVVKYFFGVILQGNNGVSLIFFWCNVSW